MALTRLGLNQSINLASNVTGTLATGNLPTVPVTKGGTGLTSGTTDQILKFTGSTTIASAAEAAGGKVLQCLSYTQGAATLPVLQVMLIFLVCLLQLHHQQQIQKF